ncbi:sigma70-ECF: RNA polymerase sigma factor, sigma-70 family [Gaiella occulta]|uniref:Sigma70-ECF: RNA polymerase sigma factor, sigma-70 family n=1 Tax=Gaiella occulta TaxID=1002870 RepID=A0A7M2Z0X9_9ACTN|nr:sigma-70 family RNA polymerase sigma factor [Gaiella occulta]RDI75941.1 sigma70-ECF: RNA polymerase sigma factor, sigma-70 family [Gaiella occulta]
MAAFERTPAHPGNSPARDGSDPAALCIGRLYEEHSRMIRALCQLLLRNPFDAEDAAQQTFLSAFGSLIDGTVPKLPAPWLATIARRECWARTAQRRRQPVALDESNAPASAADNPLDEAIRNLDLAALWRAINDLPRKQRTAFLMREFAGLSYAEVAEALGATESAIESLLVRARRQVRDGLEPAVRAANLVLTPVVLLQHRLGRLLGERGAATGAAATAGIPAAAKLGALVGAVVVGSAGIGGGVLYDRTTAHRAPLDLSARTPAPNAGTVSSALDRLLGEPVAGSLFPLTSGRDPLGSPPYASDRAAVPSGGISPAGATTAGSAQAPSEGTSTGAAGTDSNPADPAADPTASSNPSSAADSPETTDTAPTDTTPPADMTSSVDTTPTLDPAPADSSPTATDDPATAPTDTTAGP